jgi:hypothetical protein
MRHKVAREQLSRHLKNIVIPSNEGDVTTELEVGQGTQRIGQNRPRFFLHVGRRLGISPF